MSGSTTSPTIDDGSAFKADGPLKEILSVFNGGSPLNIVNALKSVTGDGFTVSGKANFMGDEEATRRRANFACSASRSRMSI